MNNNEKRKILKEVVRALEAIDVGASETALAILTDLAEDLLDQVDGIMAIRGVQEATLKLCGRPDESDVANTNDRTQS